MTPRCRSYSVLRVEKCVNAVINGNILHSSYRLIPRIILPIKLSVTALIIQHTCGLLYVWVLRPILANLFAVCTTKRHSNMPSCSVWCTLKEDSCLLVQVIIYTHARSVDQPKKRLKMSEDPFYWPVNRIGKLTIQVNSHLVFRDLSGAHTRDRQERLIPGCISNLGNKELTETLIIDCCATRPFSSLSIWCTFCI